MNDRILTNHFRRMAEMGVSAATGINHNIVRQMGNGNYAGAAEMGMRQQINRMNREERIFANSERVYDQADRRWQMMQERHANRPDILAREEDRYLRARERYGEAHMARHGAPPPGWEQEKQARPYEVSAQEPQYAPPPAEDGDYEGQYAPPPAEAGGYEGQDSPPPRNEPPAPQSRDTDFKPWTGFENVPAGRGNPPPEPERPQVAAEPQLQPIEEPAPVELAPVQPVPTDSSLQPRPLQEVSTQPFKLPPQDAKVLQAGLTLMGIESGPIDGVIGPKTKAGLIQYIADKPELAGASPQEVLASVREGMRDNPNVQTKMMDVISDNGTPKRHDVMAVQVGLNELAGTGLKVDGKVGLDTSRAVIGYLQTSYDGMVGEVSSQPPAPPSEPPAVDREGPAPAGTAPPLSPQRFTI